MCTEKTNAMCQEAVKFLKHQVSVVLNYFGCDAYRLEGIETLLELAQLTVMKINFSIEIGIICCLITGCQRNP